MDPTLSVITAAGFVGGVSTFAAGWLVVRDLFFPPEERPKPLLQRLPLARDDRPPQGWIDRLDRSFERLVVETGLDTTPMVTCLLMICGGLIAGGGLLLWTDEPLPGFIGLVVGMALPLPYLIYRRSSRIRDIQAQLADGIDLLARAVRAGESLDQAVDLVGQKGPEPLAREFRRCARHLNMGLSLPAAMRALSYRVRLMEIRIFATTLAVHRQTGGNLASTMDRMAAVIRDRLAYRRQLRATTAAGRFSAMLVGTAGPLLFAYMFLFQQDYAMKLVTLPVGQTLLVVALVLEVIGLVWIIQMLRTDY